MKLSFIILFGCFVLLACDTNDLLGKISMGDVHMTDENGNAIGGGSDVNEWRFDHEIDEKVEIYFDVDKSICTELGSAEFFSPYPNPVIDFITFSFRLDRDMTSKFIIVDECYEVFIEKEDTWSSGTNQLSLDLFNLTAGKIYRMFYKFTDGDCVLSGYGDIQMQ